MVYGKISPKNIKVYQKSIKVSMQRNQGEGKTTSINVKTSWGK